VVAGGAAVATAAAGTAAVLEADLVEQTAARSGVVVAAVAAA